MEQHVDDSMRLGRYLSPLSAWALSFGCAVGWGAFVMPGTALLPLAGPLGTLIGLAAGAAVMFLVGRNYHYLIQHFPDKAFRFRLAEHHRNRTHRSFVFAEAFHHQPDGFKDLPVFFDQRHLFPGYADHQGNQQFLPHVLPGVFRHQPIEKQPLVHRMLVHHQQLILIFHQDKSIEKRPENLHGLPDLRQYGIHLLRTLRFL